MIALLINVDSTDRICHDFQKLQVTVLLLRNSLAMEVKREEKEKI